MTSRERVLAALSREEPDRVPWCEIGIDRSLAQRLMGWGEPESDAFSLEVNQYSIEEMKALASRLGTDCIYFVLRAPVYAEKLPGQHGRLFYGEGQVRGEADLGKLQLPDPTDPALYADAQAFARNKERFAAFLVTRVGIFPTMLSLGFERFSVALFENRELVEAVLDRYCDWCRVVAEHVCGMGFDAFLSSDDMAFKTAPYFSPQIFRELVLPRYRRVGEKISLPWIIHSDGNLTPFLDDLVELGIAGLHPNERGAMDIRQVKRRYGSRLCVLGNVDLNLLGAGTPEQVEEEVRELMRDLAPGGGYILTSGNSLASYCRPENVRALARAARKYGNYPIRL
jgi:uroporphyrinogen decarboxylase